MARLGVHGHDKEDGGARELRDDRLWNNRRHHSSSLVQIVA
jgi:hypothetical protein